MTDTSIQRQDHLASKAAAAVGPASSAVVQKLTQKARFYSFSSFS